MKSIPNFIAQSLIAVMLLACQHAQSASLPPPLCKEAKWRIYTINGVLTDPADAVRNSQAYFGALGEDPGYGALKAKNAPLESYIPNPTESVLLDLFETLQQTMVNLGSDLVEKYVLAAWYGIELAGFQEHQAYSTGQIDFSELANPSARAVDHWRDQREKVIAASRSIVAGTLSRAATREVLAWARTIATAIKAGEFVLLVPHSQGNLFAKQLYDAVNSRLDSPDERQRLRVLNIASPTRDLPSRTHVLLESDIVISDLPFTRPTTEYPLTPLEARELRADAGAVRRFNKRNFGDERGHSFIQVYLNDLVEMTNGKTLRQQVVAATRRLLDDYSSHSYCTVIRPQSPSVPVGGSIQLQAFLQLDGIDLQRQPPYSWSPVTSQRAATMNGPGSVSGVRIGSDTFAATDLQMQTSTSVRVTVGLLEPIWRHFHLPFASESKGENIFGCHYQINSSMGTDLIPHFRSVSTCSSTFHSDGPALPLGYRFFIGDGYLLQTITNSHLFQQFSGYGGGVATAGSIAVDIVDRMKHVMSYVSGRTCLLNDLPGRPAYRLHISADTVTLRPTEAGQATYTFRLAPYAQEFQEVFAIDQGQKQLTLSSFGVDRKKSWSFGARSSAAANTGTDTGWWAVGFTNVGAATVTRISCVGGEINLDAFK